MFATVTNHKGFAMEQLCKTEAEAWSFWYNAVQFATGENVLGHCLRQTNNGPDMIYTHVRLGFTLTLTSLA